MKRLVVVVVFLLSACAGDSGGSDATYSMMLPSREDGKYFATEHRVSVDLPEDALEARFNQVIRYCAEDKSHNCTLLSSEVSQRDHVSATLVARLLPGGVEQMIEFAARGGLVIHRSTSSEDLAEPIIDMQSRLEMLEQHQADLADLRDRSGNDADALIKISAEMAETQSKLEALRGEHQHLRTRTELDVLTISFSSVRSRSFFAPIRWALRDFADDLSDGIAQAITGIAFLLPWLLILVPIGLGIRKLFRKWK